MKQLFAALVLSFILVSPSFAKRDIVLTKEKGKWHKDHRSINQTPTVSHDENIFYIHSETLIENTQITIKDLYDNIIYSVTVTILSNENTITIPNMTCGSYTLELGYDDNYYYGYFEVTQ